MLQERTQRFGIGVICEDHEAVASQTFGQAGQHVVDRGGSTNVELGGQGQPHMVQAITRSPSPATLVHNVGAAFPLKQLKLPLCEPRFPGSWEQAGQVLLP